MSVLDTNLIDDTSTLPQLFNKALDQFYNVGKSDEPTNTLEIQVKIKKCIKILENATILCSLADIFSRNEVISEVSTEHLQYLLLPALLGSLHLKLTSGERRNIVEVSEIYFKDFMKRCVDYNLCKYDFNEKTEKEISDNAKPEESENEMEELMILARRRAIKINRYREQQELKKRLDELKANMENDHGDEEIKRNYFLTMIQLYIYEAIEELNSLEFEKRLIDHMEKINKSVKPKMKKPSPPFRPVIITKEGIQNKVHQAYNTSNCGGSINKNIRDGIFSDLKKKAVNFTNCYRETAKSFVVESGVEINSLEEIETDDYHIIEAMRQGGGSQSFSRENWRIDRF